MITEDDSYKQRREQDVRSIKYKLKKKKEEREREGGYDN